MGPVGLGYSVAQLHNRQIGLLSVLSLKLSFVTPLLNVRVVLAHFYVTVLDLRRRTSRCDRPRHEGGGVGGSVPRHSVRVFWWKPSVEFSVASSTHRRRQRRARRTID